MSHFIIIRQSSFSFQMRAYIYACIYTLFVLGPVPGVRSVVNVKNFKSIMVTFFE